MWIGIGQLTGIGQALLIGLSSLTGSLRLSRSLAVLPGLGPKPFVQVTPTLAAVTRVRFDTPGRRYFDKKLAEGKTKKEALRALKRRISDAVYRRLIADQQRATS